MALLKFKRSAVPGKVPTLADLSLGELAINTYDGKVYIRKDSGTASIVEVGGGSGVLSFNSRTGAVTLTSGDVTGALGYTPYNSSNPAGYISGITSGMVTTALGYTPANRAGETFTGNVVVQGSAASTVVNPPAGTQMLSHSGAPGAGQYGASLNFVQQWWSGAPTSLISVGQIVGVKENSNGSFGGGLAFFVGPAGANTLSEAMRIGMSGSVTAYTDLRTPIFYDSNDTGYFLNPNGTSLLGAVQVNNISIDPSNIGAGAAIGTITEGSTGFSAPGIAFGTGTGQHGAIVYGGGIMYFGAENGSDNTLGVKATLNNAGVFAAEGDFRAPIFYDSNNTGYYVDPASGSKLFDLNIEGTGNKYLQIWSTSGNEAMVRYIGGSGSSWYVGKRTAAQLVGTADFHFFAENPGATVAGIDTAGNIFASGSVRAPIFYDSANTGYYVDPNGTSRLGSINADGLTVNSRINGGINGDARLLYSDTGTNGGGLQYWNVLDNTTLNPANGWYYGLRMAHGDADTYYNATVAVSFFADDFYLRRKVGGVDQTWRRFWHNGDSTISASNDFRAPIFYDSNDTAYYVDPASTSNLYRVSAFNALSLVGGAPFVLTGSGATPDNSTGARLTENYGPLWNLSDSATWHHQVINGSMLCGFLAGGTNWGSGKVVANGDMRAPIFYDFNNTAYYLDPNGTTNLWSVQLNDRLSLVKDRGHFTGIEATSSAGGRSQIALNSGYSDVVIASQTSNVNHGSTLSFTAVNPGDIADYRKFVINQGNWGGSHLLRFGWRDGTFPNPHLYVEGGFGGAYDVLGLDGLNKITYAYNQLRTPIIYDLNDTGYYVDPNSISQFWRINAADYIYTSSDVYGRRFIDIDNQSYLVDPASHSYLNTLGLLGGLSVLYNNPADRVDGAPWYGIGGMSDNQRVQVAGYYGLRLRSASAIVDLAGDFAQANGSFRSPIFYDSNNTNFYLDPNGGSRMNSIQADEVYAFGWFRNNNSGSGIYNQATGQHFYSDSANGWNIAGGGSNNWLRFRDTNGGTVRGYLYADNGNSIGFLNSGGNWRARVVSDDYFLVEGSSARAPIFYDSNNTAFFVDPNGTSNLSGLTVANTINGSITGNADTVDGRHASYFYPNITDNGYVTGDISGNTAHQRLWGTDSVQDMFAFNQPTEVEYSTDGVNWIATTCPPDVFDGKIYGEWGGMSMNVGNNIGGWRFVRMTWRNFGYRFFSHFTLAHSTNGHSFNFVFYKSDLNGNFSSEAFRMNGISSWPGYTFVKHENVSGWWDTRDIRIVFELNHSSGFPGNPINVGHIGLMGSYGGFNRVFDWNASREVTFLGASVRAPIYYDQNNTAYYVDPANITQLVSLTASDIISNIDIRTPIFRDLNDTSFYVDPAGFSFLSSVSLGAQTWRSDITWNGGVNVNVNSESSFDVYSGGTCQIWDTTSGAPFLKCTAGTNVEIGQAGSRGLYVFGAITASGNVTAFSDIRVKDNVEQIGGALDRLQAIRGVTYTRNDLEDKERRYAGVIAQEIEAVLPEAVFDSDGKKSVDYNATIGLLIEAIKELRAEVAELKGK